MGKFRDGMPVTGEAVTLILSTIDRIKDILGQLEATGTEPEGADADLIDASITSAEDSQSISAPEPSKPVSADETAGTLTYPILERPLRPGEVSLDDLERAFRETFDRLRPLRSPRPKCPRRPLLRSQSRRLLRRKWRTLRKAIGSPTRSIRVNVDTLEHLMTMVSELVLTRNQLLEVAVAKKTTDSRCRCNKFAQRHRGAAGGRDEDAVRPIGDAWRKLTASYRSPLERIRQADRTRDAWRRRRTRPSGSLISSRIRWLRPW